MKNNFHNFQVLFQVRFFLFATILLLTSNKINAQLCGNDGGCAKTNYANFGYNSNNDPATIEYDNFQSAFHATVIRTAAGKFQVWGERTKADALNHNFVPSDVNVANYPGLTGMPLKITIGGAGNGHSQIVLLTTTGLFAWGSANDVFSTVVKPSMAFGPVNMAGFGGQANGLPVGVSPTDVKVMTASSGTLGILTCAGEVWMYTLMSSSAGDGSTTPTNSWHKVTTVLPGNPALNNIISLRLTGNSAIALASDNKLWVWGKGTFDGSSAKAISTRAKNIPNPKTTGTIKMIGITHSGTPALPGPNVVSQPSYYVLYTDGNLYALGSNASRQLGQWGTSPYYGFDDGLTWRQPTYNSETGPPMSDIKWISPNEHSSYLPAISVLTNQAQIYSWGVTGDGTLGHPRLNTGEPMMPAGIAATDKILVVVQGGHTAMTIKLNEPKMGYTGHYVNGSAGNNDPNTDIVNNQYYGYSFVNMPEIKVCGLETPFVNNISGCGALDLTTAIQSTNVKPLDAEIRWFNGDNPLTATQITNITAVAPGTYYAFYYYGTTTSYSPASAPVVATSSGSAGTVAPVINPAPNYIVVSSSYKIPCGATTANISGLTASNKLSPATVTLTWHTASPATTANKISNVTALSGTTKYFAAFFDSVNGCYSPTKEIIVYAAICATDDNYGATPITYGVGGTLPNIFANDTYNGPAVSLPLSSVAFKEVIWVHNNARVNITSDGKLNISATTPPGIYTYTYSITDLDTDGIEDSNISYATVTFRVVPDSDGDGINDELDVDDDNDGILDTAECSNSINDMFAVFQAGNLPEIVPSDFGLTLNQKNQEVSKDLSQKFGYPANSGAVIVTIKNASVHPTTNVWWTKNGQQPSVWTITGKLSAFVLMSQNNEYFGNDSKTIYGYTAPVTPITGPAGYVNQTPVAGQWGVMQTTIQKTLSRLNSTAATADWRYADMNFGSKSFGFSTTTATGDPTYVVRMYLECDSDNDGIPNRLDLDSDSDGCADAVEGGASITSSQLVAAGGTLSGGSTSVNTNLCASAICVSSSGSNAGLPQITTPPSGYSNTTGQTVGDSQSGAINSCGEHCTKPGDFSVAGVPTKVGISVQKKGADWPENIPNGQIVLESREKGFVITRVAHVSFAPQTTDAIALPVTGMIVYDIQDSCVKLFNGVNWNCIKRSCNDIGN